MRSKYLHHYFDYDFSVIRWSWGNFSTYCQFDDRTFYTNSTTELFIETTSGQDYTDMNPIQVPQCLPQLNMKTLLVLKSTSMLILVHIPSIKISSIKI